MRFATFALAVSSLAVTLVGAVPQDSSVIVPKPSSCCPDYCVVCVGTDPCNPSLQIEYPVCGCAIQTTKCAMKKTGEVCIAMIKTCMGGTSIGGCELDNHFCLEEYETKSVGMSTSPSVCNDA